jgi:hypothetical protein
VHLHSPLQILNSFCRDCYLTSYNSPTLDPRSLFVHNPHYELNTPSLNDVSEDTIVVSREEAAVERHDASTNSVQRNRTELVFDASQRVTDGGGVLYDMPTIPARSSISSTSESLASVTSTPSLDVEGRNYTPISSTSPDTMDVLTETQLSSGQIAGAAGPRQNCAASPSTSFAGPFALPDGKFMCSRCPREFKSQEKAR